MKPLNYGEHGPPYLVNGLVLTKGYAPNEGRYWAVYTLANWHGDGDASFKTQTQKEALQRIRWETRKPRFRLQDFRLETYDERSVLLSALTMYRAHHAELFDGEKRALETVTLRLSRTECQPGGCQYCDGGHDAYDNN